MVENSCGKIKRIYKKNTQSSLINNQILVRVSVNIKDIAQLLQRPRRFIFK